MIAPEQIFQAFHPSAGEFQKRIFEGWLKEFRESLAELNYDERHQQKGEPFNLITEKTIRYLFPEYFLFRSPFYIPDLQKAVELFRMAHDRKESVRVGIYSDRDADGLTSGSMLALFLRDKVGILPDNILYLTPQEEDKYGFVEDAADRFLPFEPDLLIMTDLGSSNAAEIQEFRYASEKNPAIIVIDHHTIPEKESDYPMVEAFLNPKRLSVGQPERDLCSAGLALKLIHGFLYSYTPEYNKRYLIEGQEPVIIQNGVPVGKGDVDAVIRFSEASEPAEENPFDRSWKHLLRTEPAIGDFSRKLAQLGISIPPQWKLNILTNHHFKNIREKLSPWFILAATGTIADLMPLLDDNRIIVNEGLKKVSDGASSVPVGIKELCKVCDVFGKPVTSQDFAFSVGPLINAAGRLGKAKAASDLLLEKDPLEAARLAKELKKLNEERKHLSKEAFEILKEDNAILESDFIVIAYDERIHRGISGLVASKLAEHFARPAIVMVEDGDCIRGSIRAYTNEDVYSLIQAHANWFIQFGGHRQAAGFSLPPERIESFKEAVLQEAAALFAEREAPPECRYLIEIEDKGLRRNLWDESELLAPYGKGNPYPSVLLKHTQEIIPAPLGKTGEHSKLQFPAISDPHIEAVWFFQKPDEIATHPSASKGFLFEPQKNYFRGKVKFQLRILSQLKTPENKEAHN